MGKSKQDKTCPCGTGMDYEQCCGPYLLGKKRASDAEKLMRSRYTAYVLEDELYLKETWHPSTRPSVILEKPTFCKWISLNVISHHQEEKSATVEFIAKYKINGKAEKMHEKSQFILEGGRWFYTLGT